MAALLREFLELSYEELEELNLEAKAQRLARMPADQIQEQRLKYLTDTKGIKAVTVCFSDLEGRLHMLDYDKKFLVKSADNLTFDGSSIRGFTAQSESDLCLGIDWSAFYWLPADVFGPGKVFVFGEVQEKDGSPYAADMRVRLKQFANKLYEEQGLTANAANEIEGFLFKGQHAEQSYVDNGGFEFVSTTGYYHTLPGDPLRQFIDSAAEVQRAMGFCNEKDHPEVAPSQFEMNYSYTEVTIAADQIQLYKLLSRQVAALHNMTACFLPKPVTGVNGSGMHTNLSLSKGKQNLFYDAKNQISSLGWDFVHRILNSALDICLVLNPSVNAYRRLDPHYEAPNEIKASPVDRGSMIRIPIANERSARIEVRSIAPDANPYLALYTLLNTGIYGELPDNPPDPTNTLPDNIYDAMDDFRSSCYMKELLGADIHEKYADLKLHSAERCPAKLGTIVKKPEVQFHHEVYNQYLWSKF
ncbi:MAG: glutamine synthetase [Anaerolineae bacterium]|nr:glutamine synthetase [Anaerolineae bacterium]